MFVKGFNVKFIVGKDYIYLETLLSIFVGNGIESFFYICVVCCCARVYRMIFDGFGNCEQEGHAINKHEVYVELDVFMVLCYRQR